MHMGSQFITAGDLFVEVVDNADASDPPARDEARMAAIKDGTFEDGRYRFDRYNRATTASASSTAVMARPRTSSMWPGGAA